MRALTPLTVSCGDEAADGAPSALAPLTSLCRERTLVRTYEEVPGMTTITATEARKRLYKLLDDVADSHEPVQITGKRGNAVLVGEDDWRAVQETLYLVSIPGMRESIIEGMATPPEELDSELRW